MLGWRGYTFCIGWVESRKGRFHPALNYIKKNMYDKND